METKTDNEHPPWLKSMQNGAIGEARTRAFLLDRFWVLERSVDIDGADFIIQRRLTTNNLLDREAPRLGVVQVKFFGTLLTAHYVHKQYVLDKDGNPRAEFFLQCHSGDEENQKIFLLTAADIHGEFVLTTNSGAEKYYIPRNKIDDNGKFEIKNKKLALDRIENNLALADFAVNRRFMSWVLPSAKKDLDGILQEFKEPLDNNYCDIPEYFRELKKKARNALFNVEEIYNLIRKVAESVDPLEADSVIKEISCNCRTEGGNSYNWSISIPDLNEDEFFDACRAHKKIIERLRNDGLLDNFVCLIRDVEKAIMTFLEPLFPFDRAMVHDFIIHYSADTFAFEKIESRWLGISAFLEERPLVKPNNQSWIEPVVTEISKGQINAFWIPGRYRYTQKTEEERFENFSKSCGFNIVRGCKEFIYDLRYCENE